MQTARQVAGLIVSLAALAGGTSPASAAAPPIFTSVLVASGQSTGEPGIAFDPNHRARLYVDAPEDTTQVWMSPDGGKSFNVLPATRGGGGDADIAVDDVGRLYALDMRSPASYPWSPLISIYLGPASSPQPSVVSMSSDGLSWNTSTILTGSGGDDRPWIAAWGNGQVIVEAHAGPCIVWVSGDAASTFAGPVTATGPASYCGPIRRGPDDTLHFAYVDTNNRVLVASSSDGMTWNLVSVGDLPSTRLSVETEVTNPLHVALPILAIDDSNDLFVAVGVSSVATFDPTGPVGTTSSILFAASSDRGQSWGAWQRISSPRRTSIVPWVTAGTQGRVAVAWYQSSDSLEENVETPVTRWSIEVATADNAIAPTPNWAMSVAVPNVHTGSICTMGSACPDGALIDVPRPLDRRLLDFFQIGCDASGRLFVAYPRDGPIRTGDIVLPTQDIMLGEQSGGALLR